MKQKRSKLKISMRFGNSYREGEYLVHRQKKVGRLQTLAQLVLVL